MDIKFIGITPQILREAGFKESHFPTTSYTRTVESGAIQVIVKFVPAKETQTYTMSIDQIMNGVPTSRCCIYGVLVTSYANKIMRIFQPDHIMPYLPE